tara:strand:+ start:35 stop:1486 length:1452 start_codon:yes stop_codon:yes gene_type:complete
MKIAYVGNYKLDFTTENHIAKTLESLGHEVVRIQEHPAALPGWLSQVPEDTDLFLFTRTWGKMVTLNDLARLKEMGIPTASYHLDLYVGLSRQSGIETDPFWRTEYVFSADGDPESQKYFESKGINHHWLLPAVYKGECYMVEPNNDPQLQGDVIFVGGGVEYGHPEWPYRRQLVKHLEETYGEKYKKYGHPQLSVRGAALNQLYANAKIAVGDSINIGFRHRNYTSDRLFESIGRGAFTIYPDIDGITELFPQELRGIFYKHGDFEDLDKKIDYYLTHEEEREHLRRGLFEFVYASQTYSNRLQELLDKLMDLGAFDDQKSHTEPLTEQRGGVRINLGAGEDPASGWINVDMIGIEGIDVVHNLINFPYPFEDGVADEIKAVDVIEHLPPYIGEDHGVVRFIEECHRILKPGGTLYMQTPGWKAEFLWIDPTHVRGFDVQSMDFFDPDKHFGKTTGFYSKCKFKVKSEELENHNIRFWMEKR